MPLSAAVSLLVVHQTWLEHVCLLDMFNVYSMLLSLDVFLVSFDCDCLG